MAEYKLLVNRVEVSTDLMEKESCAKFKLYVMTRDEEDLDFFFHFIHRSWKRPLPYAVQLPQPLCQQPCHSVSIGRGLSQLTCTYNVLNVDPNLDKLVSVMYTIYMDTDYYQMISHEVLMYFHSELFPLPAILYVKLIKFTL